MYFNFSYFNLVTRFYFTGGNNKTSTETHEMKKKRRASDPMGNIIIQTIITEFKL